MQKHVKARDAGKKICSIVIFYEVCLFLFSFFLISSCWKYWKLGTSESWDKALNVLALYCWQYEVSTGLMIRDEGLLDKIIKDSVSKLKDLLGEEP